MMTYCAYVHARPDTVLADGIFYAGKGLLSRAKNLVRTNPHHTNVVRKHGKENILVGKIDCSSERIALDLEVGLIKCLKRMGVNLTNATLGGEGVSGFSPSQEMRAAVSKVHTGRIRPKDTGKKISAALLENISFRAGASARMKAWVLANNTKVHLGRARPLETGAKISAALRGVPLSDAHKKAVSDGRLAKGFRWMTLEGVSYMVPKDQTDDKLKQRFVFGRALPNAKNSKEQRA